jgi:integrase
VRRNYLRANPLDGTEGVGRRQHGKAQLRIDETRKLVDHCLWVARRRKNWERDGAIAVLLAVLLGLRSSEITLRVVRDVDDEGRRLWIPASKTDAGRRTLEVPGVLVPLLAAITADRAPGAPLFPAEGEHGAVIHHWRDWPSECTRRLCAEAGVPVVSAHGLRGTHASLAVEAGATGHLVAGALGHESSSTTYRSYARAEARQSRTQSRVVSIASARPGRRK